MRRGKRLYRSREDCFLMGWLLILAGGFLLLRNYPVLSPIIRDPVFPIILILGGWCYCLCGGDPGAHRP